MDLHLEGKVVVLTGGFKGIGKGIALRLAKEGAIVAVINRDDGAAEQFDAEMKAITDNYRTYLMDLNDTDDIAPIVDISSKTALTGQGKTSAYAANLLVFDASKGVHFHDEVFKDTVYFMNNVFCNTSTTPTQWYRKTDALAKAAFSNNDYYEAGGKASDTQPEDKRGLEVDPKFVGFSGGSDTPAGKLAGVAPKPRPTSTRHTPPPSCA